LIQVSSIAPHYNTPPWTGVGRGRSCRTPPQISLTSTALQWCRCTCPQIWAHGNMTTFANTAFKGFQRDGCQAGPVCLFLVLCPGLFPTWKYCRRRLSANGNEGRATLSTVRRPVTAINKVCARNARRRWQLELGSWGQEGLGVGPLKFLPPGPIQRSIRNPRQLAAEWRGSLP